jgi:valyl-tRNA synthetase
MFDNEARVVQTADSIIPAELVGLDRFEARKRVIAALDAQGLLEQVEDRVIQTPFGDRGGVVIEPWLTDQWYVDAGKLAKQPMKAVRDGRIEIVPKSWEKTFFNWMENIQPWCVSRQLWWGHRVPAWYGPRKTSDGGLEVSTSGDDESFVYETEEAALEAAGHFYQREVVLVENAEAAARELLIAASAGTRQKACIWRDPDVLDTWFSSALWPFATLGWPDDTEMMRRHYPNDVLISGFDILFFWDARMAMQGMYFNGGEVPWKRLYLHGLVRAADGQKMSKSKGNVVDPLGLIDKYGADALRFFMAAMESQGRDVKMDEKRVEGYRNFATKLWNAARFCQANGIGASRSVAAPEATSAVNRWIVGEVVQTLAELDKALAELRFDAAANAIYHFVWDQFCDWYIELIKGSFDDETKTVAGWVLDQILVMLHPFMPFVTEELWASMGERHHNLIVAQWPAPDVPVNHEARREVEWLIALIGNLRTAKAELGIAPGARLDAYLPDPSPVTRAIVERNIGAIDRLARLGAIQFAPAPAGAAMQIGAGDANIVVPLEGVIDIAAEKARLDKAKAASEKERDSLARRLENPAFVEKARPEAVAKARADFTAHAAEAQRLAAALARLD